MRTADTIKQLKELHPEIDKTFHRYKAELESGTVPWKELLLKRTIGKSIDEYTVENANFLSLAQLSTHKIEIAPGEKVRYLVVKDKHPDKKHRYITEEHLLLTTHSDLHLYDSDYYTTQLWIALKEIWESFAPDGYFRFLPSRQLYLW